MPTRTPRRHPPSAGTVGLVAAALFALLGVVWAMSSPLMGGPDEPDQTVKAVAVARGEWRGEDIQRTSDYELRTSWIDTVVTVPAGYADLNELNACFVFQPDTPSGCAPQPVDDQTLVDAITYVGTYPPTYYVLVGWPSRFLPAPQGIWAMRLASVAASAAMVGLAAAACRRMGRSGLLGAGVLVALTPVTVHLASVINPNGFEITAAIAVWATAFVVVTGRSDPEADPRSPSGPRTADLARLAVAFVLLAGTRALSPAIAVGILATVALAGLHRDTLGSLARRTDARITAATMAVGAIAAGGWVLWSKAYDSVAGAPAVGITLGSALRESWSRLPHRLHEMFGYFGWLEVPAPRALLVLWTALILVLVVGALAVGTWRHRGVLLALVALAVAIHVVPEALSASRQGFIGQGRYALPVAVGVPILAAWIVAVRARSGQTGWRRTAVAVAVAWALGQSIGLAALLRRHVVGIENDLFAFVGGTGWEPPLPPVLLWLLGAVTAVAFGAWVVVSARTEDPTGDDTITPPSDSFVTTGAPGE
ncbi:MAG: DUF2142 domain-containing protein [Acidimicrobiales bacterium]|jgi:hypothetical protein|nr:DUF2142 domain-containing protein [Acidimicrobiales bacterium]